MTAGTVLAFLKYPEQGRVKTRIAASVGDRRAAELYRDWIGRYSHSSPWAGGHDRGGHRRAEAEAFAEWGALVDAGGPSPRASARDSTPRSATRTRREPVVAVGTDCLNSTRSSCVRRSRLPRRDLRTRDRRRLLPRRHRALPRRLRRGAGRPAHARRSHEAAPTAGSRSSCFPRATSTPGTTGSRIAAAGRRRDLAVVIPVLNEEPGCRSSASLREQTAGGSRGCGGRGFATALGRWRTSARGVLTAQRGRGIRLPKGLRWRRRR